ncbi:hypothetical protein [Argonema galeatum]|uniref:hypothetical protein n=1 Tax=Argonema galeatum TaxID=2942762 RepID=UPI00201209B3|nr:hypothetical protein [Argonema galeatum]MCL1466613.1 hypothetical protein [Argonema galeatum A003/A1]
MSKLNQSGFNRSLGTKRSQQSWRTPLSVLSLVALMGMGGTFWLSSEANAQNARTRTTQTAPQSNVDRINLTLNRQPNESYNTLIRRAEAAARETAQRNFNQNGSLRAVAVTVLGQNAGAIAPLLSLEVNRQNWASRPDTQRWATYFKNAQALLRIDNPNPNFAEGFVNSTPGQVLPNGTIVPSNGTGQVLPNGTIVPGNGTGQVLPNGNIIPGGTTINGTGQVLPNGNIIPGGTTNGTGQVLPNGSIIPGGTTINGTGQVLPNGSIIPGGTPAGTTVYDTTDPGTTNGQGVGGANTSGTTNTGTTGGGIRR